MLSKWRIADVKLSFRVITVRTDPGSEVAISADKKDNHVRKKIKLKKKKKKKTGTQDQTEGRRPTALTRYDRPRGVLSL